MKLTKRVLSLLLSIVMLFSITAGIDFSSYAECLSCYYDSTSQELTILRSTDGWVTFIPEKYSNAKSLVIGEGIEYVTIDDYMNIEKLSLPASLYQITGISTFGGENKFKTIKVDNDNDRYFTYDGALYEKQDSPDGYLYTLLIYPKGSKKSKCKVYSKTDYIGESVFAYTNYLKSIDMSSVSKSVWIYDYMCFGSSVESIKMPKKIRYIGNQAFALSNLKSISLSSSIKTEFDGWATFAGCKNLTKIVLGSKTKTLPEEFAVNCPKLKGIYIPSSVKSIGYAALGAYYDADSQENIPSYYEGFTLYSNNNSAAINYAEETNTKHKKAVKPSKVSLKSLKKKSKGFTATWKKNTKAKGYQIQYSTSSKFKNAKTVTISNNKTTSKKIKKLKSKKKYYVRIRAYKTYAGKKVYSSWSKYKTVTTKK